MEIVHNKLMNSYLQQLTKHLIKRLPPNQLRVPIQVFIIKNNTSIPCAFSMSGGYIFLQLDCLASTKSEDELATRLSHEIGHITLRHATLWETQRAFFEKYILSQTVLPNDQHNSGTSTTYDNSQINAYLFLLRIQHEDAADLFAVRLALMSGYDPSDYMLFLAEQYSFPDALTGLNLHRSGDQRKALMEQEVKRMRLTNMNISAKPKNNGQIQFVTFHNLATSLAKQPLKK